MKQIFNLIAYPDRPQELANTIDTASQIYLGSPESHKFQTWKEGFKPGAFISSNVRELINQSEIFIADITFSNFNVIYEVGYAIGNGKTVIPISNKSFRDAGKYLDQLGILDTVGFESYENSEELIKILGDSNEKPPLLSPHETYNHEQPAYLLDCFRRTDFESRIISSVKKVGLFYRSFDPREQPRLSLTEAIKQVSSSSGILVPLISEEIDDASLHNLRGSFLIGLSHGMGKEVLVLQHGQNPVPIDFRDFATTIKHPDDVSNEVNEFARKTWQALQSSSNPVISSSGNFLSQINFGSSAAENEFRNLGNYFVKTHEYNRALRGEGRLVVGRKGSGKTAIFLQVRDQMRNKVNSIILDLKPDGYQLKKFKESVLDLMQEGTKEHTVTVFWEYLLYLEICHKILEKDKKIWGRNPDIYEKYIELERLYKRDDFVQEGDFSERLSKLLSNITQEFDTKYADQKDKRLTTEELTELLYIHDVHKLKENVIDYLKSKESLLILIDNLDKGWPTQGVGPDDVLMIRTLLEATRKIEKTMARENISGHSLVFLRNDVYEKLIDNTPDRGKEGLISIDWTDPKLLSEIIFQRLVFNGVDSTKKFEHIWREICDPIYNGEASSEYLIKRCLMRPRCLLDLIEYCVSHAVNLRREKIQAEDIEKGLVSYSMGLIRDFGYEIRDVWSEAEDVLYSFISSSNILSKEEIYEKLKEFEMSSDRFDEIIEYLLWYGFLGILKAHDEEIYIYDLNYDMKHMLAHLKKENFVVGFCINPAFWQGLGIAN